MKNKFTKRAEDALKSAKSFAEEMGHTFIGTEHILIGLISETGSVAAKLLESKGADKSELIRLIIIDEGKGNSVSLSTDDMTERAKKAILNASKHSERMGCNSVGTEHLLRAIIDENGGAVRLLTEASVSAKEIKGELSVFFGAIEEMKEKPQKKENQAKETKKGGLSYLAQYGRNLTELASKQALDPVIGREKEISRVTAILSRKTKNNPLLIGEPGVGKTAIAEGLAIAIATKNIPECLYDKQIICLDLSAMISGAKYRGEFEERLKNAINEAQNDKDVILFVDEIHTIIGAGSAEGAMDAANILKPPLARGEIRMIGATTFTEYTRHIEKDAALERRFQAVSIFEPSEKETLKILSGIKGTFERHHGIKIDESALKEAIRLSVELIHDRFLPDKAIDILDESASYLRIIRSAVPNEILKLQNEIDSLRAKKEEAINDGDIDSAKIIRSKEIKLTKELIDRKSKWQAERRANTVTLDDKAVKEAVSKQILSVKGPDAGASEFSYNKLLCDLQARIIGQDSACISISEAILRAKIGLNDKNRPLASFLFVGPSGVGKTSTAEQLSESLYGENSLIRFDMAEFTEKQSISKLIGSPPGYVGYDEPGKLTQALRNKSDCLILFDEVDKACPDVISILQQILESGTLTDNKGKRAYFRNSVIVLTCNARDNGRTIGFTEKTKTEIRSDFPSIISDGLLSKIDEIIEFKALENEAIKSITEKSLHQISEKLSELGYKIKFNYDFNRNLINLCDARDGRSIIKTVRKYAESPISRMIIEGAVTKDAEYEIECVNGKIVCKQVELI